MVEIHGIKASDIMLREFPVTSKAMSLLKAVKIMEKHGLDRVVVVDGEKLEGILSKWDIIVKLGLQRSLMVSSSRFKVSSFMNTEVVTVSPSSTLPEILETMVKNNIGSLVVVEESKPVGLITRWRILDRVVDYFDLRASDLLRVLPIVLKTSDRIIHARRAMIEYDLSYLPVVRDEKPIGYVTVEEIARAFLDLHDVVEIKHRKKRLETMIVSDYMRYKPIMVNINEQLPKIYGYMKEKNCRGSIVVSGERIVGIVTLKELIETINNKLSTTNP